MRTLCWSLVATAFAAAPALGQPPMDPKVRLEKSPRHHEWVQVKHGSRTVHCFMVFPEVKDKKLAIVVIHENKGLTEWVRSLTDQLAEVGYIAIAPDLLSGMGPKGGNTDAFKSVGDATKALNALPPDQVTADLNAVADYAKKIPAATGRFAVCGFCWGGRQTFRFATNRADIASAYVFYGDPPDADSIPKIKCPVYGFYGGNDARINATIEPTVKLMKDAGKFYQPVIYDGAGHGFMRAGEEPGAMAANLAGRNKAWERWRKLLGEETK